ncbi:MAG TPA: iron ABC transporter permease [Polyangia bacterium]|nr:iron ABC transporter permease [Polyangia bacterium]
MPHPEAARALGHEAERPRRTTTEPAPRLRRPAVRRGALAGALVALTGAALAAGLLIGPAPLSLREVVGAIGRRLAGHAGGWQDVVVVSVRLPRAVVALLVGGALGISGAALQGLFRNPLADPGVLGVSSGASLGAVLAIALGLAGVTVWALPGCAFAGAAADVLLVFAIAARRGRGRLFSGTLLLVGVAVGALNASLSTFVLSATLARYDAGRQIVYWLLGALEARTWDHVLLGGPAILAGSAVIAAHARELDALMLGEVGATSVGVDVPRVRRRLVLASALVVGAAVAIAGPIGFVGLLVPHLVRLGLGAGHRALLPLSFAGGGLFLLLADLVARAIPARTIPVGVVTAAIGAPAFLALLLRRRAGEVAP